MEAVVLVVHLMLALALIGIILIQKSEGGGLGIGGGGGGMGGLATARGAANLLTRATTFLAIGFLITSLSLAILAKNRTADSTKSILDLADDAAVSLDATAETPEITPPVVDVVPDVPEVPVSE